MKPLPPEDFTVLGTNAELRWDSPGPVGDIVPVSRFFVRNHSATPRIDVRTCQLELFGSGLRGGPVRFSYDDLLRLPSETVTAAIECAGNGRGFFTSQQGQTVSGTAWKLGAIGVARWRGVPLATVLARAGLARRGGRAAGRARRRLRHRRGQPRPRAAPAAGAEGAAGRPGRLRDERRAAAADHGFPARLVVPHWTGIASIKWLGRIEVSRTPLATPWDTQYYRLTGPDHPAAGELVTRQNAKSVFELPWHATLAAGRDHVLRRRSWSGTGGISRVEVSTDDGRTWRRATFAGSGRAWQRWAVRWRAEPGDYVRWARAVDRHGQAQPDVEPYNTQGYLFGAVVRHPVRCVRPGR